MFSLNASLCIISVNNSFNDLVRSQSNCVTPRIFCAANKTLHILCGIWLQPGCSPVYEYFKSAHFDVCGFFFFASFQHSSVFIYVMTDSIFHPANWFAIVTLWKPAAADLTKLHENNFKNTPARLILQKLLAAQFPHTWINGYVILRFPPAPFSIPLPCSLTP